MASKVATKTLLTVKVDKKLKEKAQKTAERVGLPLGTVVNGFLRQFVRDKRIVFSEETPTVYLERLLIEAEKEIARGDISPAFTTGKSAAGYLRSQR